MAGDLLAGRYRVVRQLGKGAMGEAYLVEHARLGRPEVMKVLPSYLSRDPGFVQRFRREARASNRLQHPGIVLVYDYGTLEDGRYFLTFEYVEGENLDLVFARSGPFPVDRALVLLEQLADAVGFGHASGIVHRNLKPRNLILMSRAGRADVLKVLDFGLARMVSGDAADNLGSLGSTPEESLVANPAYMAPEAFASATGATPPADVYAIGCIACELLTGRTPFLGRPGELTRQHMSKAPPSLTTLRVAAGGDALPLAVEALVMRCLDKAPTRRFRDGRALAAAVRECRQTLLSELTALDAPVWESSTWRDPSTDRFQAPDLSRVDAARVRQVASILRDRGEFAAELTVALAAAAEVDVQLAHIEAELTSLDTRSMSAASEVQTRMASLRFAAGELSFDRQAATDPRIVRDLSYQIEELEERIRLLDFEARRHAEDLSQQLATLERSRDQCRAHFVERHTQLEALVLAAAVRHVEHPEVAAFVRLGRPSSPLPRTTTVRARHDLDT